MPFDDACECLMAAFFGYVATPSVTEVLDADARHGVCTATQCFESDADAFGLVAPSAPSPLLTSIAAAAALALWLAAARSSRRVK